MNLKNKFFQLCHDFNSIQDMKIDLSEMIYESIDLALIWLIAFR